MDKSEKHQIGQREDMSMPEKVAALYGGSSKTQVLLSSLPYVGAALHTILSSKGQEFAQKRIQLFLEELDARLKLVEGEITLNKNEEDYFDLIQASFGNVAKAHSEHKIKRFAIIVSDYVTKDEDWDETELVMDLVSELSDTHIQILKYMNSLPAPESGPFQGRQVAAVFSGAHNEAPSLLQEFKDLSSGAVSMYCSSLISKGLLHDEGIGRTDCPALHFIAPSVMTAWFLKKIQEIDGKQK